MSLFFWWTVFVVLIGGILEGYTLCVIAGALPCFSKEFALCPSQEGLAASSILLGALLGTMISGYIADRFGRKKCLVFIALLYVSTAACGFSILDFLSLLILRFFTGIAVGMTGVLGPLYLAEIAPAKKRGTLISLFYVSLALGTLFAFVVNIVLMVSENWRLMFFLASIPAAFQLGALGFFQESPRWLLGAGLEKKAQRAMRLLYGNQQAVHEISEGTHHEKHVHEKWRYLFHPCFSFVVFLGVFLSLFQQLSGINAIIAYAPKILANIGFASLKGAMIPTLCLASANLFATLIAARCMDRFGRKKLLLLSQCGVCVSLIVFMLARILDVPFLSFWGIGALSCYIAFYSIGLGPVLWVILSEIYPLIIRAKAISLATFVNWVAYYLVVLTFPYLLNYLGIDFVFLFYAIFTLSSVCFFYFFLPETKGKTLEELENILVDQSKKDF